MPARPDATAPPAPVTKVILEEVLSELGLGEERRFTQNPIAFLVDGDNASPELLPEMLAESSKYGSVLIRRVYGDWTSPQMNRWKKVLQEHALVPVQQFANVSGKNATDSAMIIDAMDILHSKLVRGFCLVSSDSDYTRLATRVREAGLFVMGIGEPKTPMAFRNGCHVFVSTENLRGGVIPTPSLEPSTRDSAREILLRAFDKVEKDDGLATLADLGQVLRRLDPSFDPRTYGEPRLVDLVRALPDTFTIERPKDAGPGELYVRRKRGREAPRRVGSR